MLDDNKVAPCVGAWIETFSNGKDSGVMLVAPCVGAWIETNIIDKARFLRTSHPAWVRGLKQKPCIVLPKITMSHPAWVRGLKLHYLTTI